MNNIQFDLDLFKKSSLRERQIVALLAQGMRTKDIARELCVSHDTIESHRHNIIRKTGLKTSPRIVAEFVKGGLIYWCVIRGTWAHAEKMSVAQIKV